MYFKGGEGLINPVDCKGNIISEGDTLTFDWFDHVYSNCFNNRTEEEIEEYVNKPCFIVKSKTVDGKSFLYGVGIEECLYLHDFRFYATKKIFK